MQGSRPHWEAELHVFAPGGTARQEPARQKFPRLQSLFWVQAATQRPAWQVVPLLQSAVVVQRGFGVHLPPVQLQRSSHSSLAEHESPGQPKVQSA
jgi:hypothetical protein